MEVTSELIKEVGAMSYLGIFGISFLANVVVPVPEEIVILIIGYVAGTGSINFLITMVVVILGALASDSIMFALSKKDNRFIKGFYHRFFAKIFPINIEFLRLHSSKVIFVSRFLVQLRFLGPFIAGQSRVTWKKFIFWETLALVIYVPVLMWAGHYFEHRINSVFDGVNTVKNILLAVLVLGVVWSLMKLVRNYFLSTLKK